MPLCDPRQGPRLATEGADRWEGCKGVIRECSCMISLSSPLRDSYDINWQLVSLDGIVFERVLYIV